MLQVEQLSDQLKDSVTTEAVAFSRLPLCLLPSVIMPRSDIPVLLPVWPLTFILLLVWPVMSMLPPVWSVMSMLLSVWPLLFMFVIDCFYSVVSAICFFMFYMNYGMCYWTVLSVVIGVN